MAIEKKVYTAHASTTGGRESGSSNTDDGKLQVKLSTPKEMAGSGGDGTNPEQLFAAGYSACFLGAMKAVAGKQKTPLPDDTTIDADVSFGPLAGGAKGYGIEVAMAIQVPGWERDKVQAIIDSAHQICPYSNATRGNIDVTLTVV
jgi:osmotically inducible protein OsmC